MKHVVIIGNGGSGKSTLARKLGARTGLPVIHLDREHWLRGWVEPPKAEWQARVAEMLERDRWIMDGNYGGEMAQRIAAADTVVFLDLRTHVCVWRVIRRAMEKRPRPDMADGCEERLDPDFIRWVYEYREKSRPKVLALLAGADAGTAVLRLTSSRVVDAWLRSISRA